jgi:two-component system phosphate regulon sensor histidine kinase PhoR
LRKQENELQAYNDQLLKKDSIKNEYVLRLTHDIKGHLAAIQLNLSLIIEKMIGELNKKQEEALTNVYKRAVRLSDFVNRLLNLTYMRLNKKIEIEAFLVHEAVKNAVSLISGIAEEKYLCLRYYVDNSLDTITNNKFAFEELISSLVLNAIRYTPDHGKIDIVVKDKNDLILIEISDSGIGIPQDEINHIFDEFYRASNAKLFKPHGTGLGLAIVKQIVQIYQGDIWVESKLNIGTTFFVQFSKNISEKLKLKDK